MPDENRRELVAPVLIVSVTDVLCVNVPAYAPVPTTPLQSKP